MLIGLDADEVLIGFLPAFIGFHNDNYGTSFSLKDYFSYQFWEVLGVEQKEGFRRVDEFFETDYFRGITPVGGAVEGVEKLSEESDLVVITSRPEKIAQETRDCLERYFPGKFSEVYFSHHMAGAWEKGRKKSEICLELGVEVLVDDCLGYVLECVNKGIKVVMPDYPYNQAEWLPPGATRVYGWEMILERVNELLHLDR